MFTQYIVIYEERFFSPWNHYHLPKNFPNGLVAWHISKPVPGGERLGNPMGNTFSMDTTWEHRWKMVKNKDRHQAKGHIFEAGIPFLWHSNFDRHHHLNYLLLIFVDRILTTLHIWATFPKAWHHFFKRFRLGDNSWTKTRLQVALYSFHIWTMDHQRF